jgi:hypothetical protein
MQSAMISIGLVNLGRAVFIKHAKYLMGNSDKSAEFAAAMSSR